MWIQTTIKQTPEEKLKDIDKNIGNWKLIKTLDFVEEGATNTILSEWMTLAISQLHLWTSTSYVRIDLPQRWNLVV